MGILITKLSCIITSLKNNHLFINSKINCTLLTRLAWDQQLVTVVKTRWLCCFSSCYCCFSSCCCCLSSCYCCFSCSCCCCLSSCCCFSSSSARRACSSAILHKCTVPLLPPHQSPDFLTFKESENPFQGTNSARLCCLAGRYDNPIQTRFLGPIDCLKIPAQVSHKYRM